VAAVLLQSKDSLFYEGCERMQAIAEKKKALTFQELLFTLQRFWADRGCVLQQPYDVEVGAGTMSPDTFLRVLGPKPVRIAYAQPSRRPADGCFGIRSCR
jgi:glycyl-tRNA synthetase alpha chain